MEIEYEPRFLDEAVLRAAGARPEGRLFYRERERVYRLADPEERARAFDRLNAAWCERLDLARPLAAALAEQPLVTAGAGRCAVGRPPDPRDTGADLLVRAVGPGEPAAAGRVLRLLFPPELLLAPTALTRLLRPELQHVADMLDPRFGYEPRLPVARGGPGHERLLRDRYRAVWDAAVAGRLARRGWLPEGERARCEAAFARAFPALGAGAPRVFARFFDEPAPTHAAILAFVAAPGAHAAPGRSAPAPCPLCGFLTADPEPDPAALGRETLAEIAHDFPHWRPADGCCRQCADLYRARPLSRREAAALPGIR
jgi:hypothetical protein